jgi:hypothetical protein
VNARGEACRVAGPQQRLNCNASVLLQGIDHYIVKSYESRGIEFDRMLLWEAEQVGGETIFQYVPKRWYHAYQFFNIKVGMDANAEEHPLNVLKAVHSAPSFVAIKVDIDTPDVENLVISTLIQRRAEYPSIAAGQMELLFEQHVHFTPMVLNWRNSALLSNKTLADSYNIFFKMRTIGIRAHGWV